MRQFILWNHLKSSSFNFINNNIIVSYPTGLGIGFDVTIENGLVTSYQRKFDDITFLLHIGVNDNAYTKFKLLADFIALNGKNKFILEYSVNGRILYADVWVKKLPKTEKNEYGILREKLELTRTSYWYEIVTGTLSSTHEIINNTSDDINVNLTINGEGEVGNNITLNNGLEIRLGQSQSVDESLIIDSENKVVTFISSGVNSNGYNRIDKSKDTFMVVPNGTYTLTKGTSLWSAIISYNYKKWVID